MEEKEYLSIDETTEYLGVNRTTLYKYIRELKIESKKFKLDRNKYLAMADIKRIQEARKKPWILGPDSGDAKKAA